MRVILRGLNRAGFSVGRKLVINGSAPCVAVAFPNYIRAKRDHSKRHGEPDLAFMFAALAIAMR